MKNTELIKAADSAIALIDAQWIMVRAEVGKRKRILDRLRTSARARSVMGIGDAGDLLAGNAARYLSNPTYGL